jgi:site-specific DNA recombinase
MSQKQVAIYARVSSKQPAEASTIKSQLAVLRERVEQDGFQLTEELVFIDEGYSGASLVRPGLERLRDLIALKGLDSLYVLSPDRLARKYAYQVLLIDEFQRVGVEVVFLNRELRQTPEDELLLQVQGIVAEYERAKIMERSRRGKRYAAQTGNVAVLSSAPYGYRYVSKEDGGGQARYEVALEEAQVVRQIFRWVGLERASIGEVCRRLQRDGVRTRTGKTAWDRSAVWGMLKNPAYKGQAAFGKTRVGPLCPRLREQRGRSLQPRRPVSTNDVPEEEWIFIPVPALLWMGTCSTLFRLNCERTGNVLGRESAGRATCSKAYSFVLSASMPTMAKPSAIKRPKARNAAMLITVVLVPMPIDLLENAFVITCRSGRICWTNWSGTKFAPYWKSHSV